MQIEVSILQELFNNKNKYFINKKNTHTGIPDNSEGYQGEYNEYAKYYRHPDMPDNLFFKETYQTDSYGYNDAVVNYSFVSGKSKKITVYEPI